MNISQERTIMINENFDAEMAGEICLEIYGLSKISKDDISVIINSKGGMVSSLESIVSALNASKCKINTILIGTTASSCAAFLFCRGNERIMLNGSQIVFHEPGLIFEGQTFYSYSEIKAKENSVRKLLEKFVDLIFNISLCSKSYIRKQIKFKEWKINANEALSLGIATKVIYSFDELSNNTDIEEDIEEKIINKLGI